MKRLSQHRLRECSKELGKLTSNKDFVFVLHTAPCIIGQLYIIPSNWKDHKRKRVVPLAHVVYSHETGAFNYTKLQPEYFNLTESEVIEIKKEIEDEVGKIHNTRKYTF